MTTTPLEARPVRAGVLVSIGLIVTLATLFHDHHLAFVTFALGGAALVAGALDFALSRKRE